MNIVAQNTASKLFVAFVAVAMLFTLAAPAKAATVEELQAQIAALMAQISSLSGGSSAPAAGACTFTRPLTVGSQGADVKCLQDYLTPTYFTNAGGSTGYFGPVTASAVAAWQSANGVTPASGYFGPVSQAKYSALMAAAGGSNNGGGSNTDDSGNGSSNDLSGEASLDSAELDTEESSIEENDENAVVGNFTVEFQDGDAEISRLDVALVGTGSANPWDAFESVSLWVDGDEVASVDAADEDDYLDEDAGELRFSGLDIVASEDEELEIAIAVTVQNNLDNDEINADWTLTVPSLRFFDADGVATTETNPAGSDEAEFDIDVAGADEELKLSLASSNPDATDVVVDTDSDTNDVTIAVAEIEAEDNDIELNRVVVRVDTIGATTTSVIDEARVVIDGQEFDAEPIVSSGLSLGKSQANGTTSVWYLFDIDGDVVVDADDMVEMEVVVDLNDTDDGARYANNGVTIKAQVTSTERDLWQAEGADDLATTQFKGTAVGDEHTLVAEGIAVVVDGTPTAVIETQDGADNDVIRYTLELEVSAFEQDVYFDTDEAVSLDWDLATSSGGVLSVPTGSTTVIFSSSGEEVTGAFEILEGETETLTIEVTYKPTGNPTAARLQLNSLTFGSSAVTPTGSSWTATPTETYRTPLRAVAD
jgi:peptidoglycan hydrolase-like protein with peptidoglycan-binding domain